MIPAGHDNDFVFIQRIYKPVFFINPPAPVTGKFSGKRLRLSNSAVSVSGNIFD
jgi:hypothetical protein